MSARIDHAAEARSDISYADEVLANGSDSEVAIAIAAVGQVHATLALVEQQRLANVIAFTVGSGYSPTSVVLSEIAAGIGMPPAPEGPF